MTLQNFILSVPHPRVTAIAEKSNRRATHPLPIWERDNTYWAAVTVASVSAVSAAS